MAHQVEPMDIDDIEGHFDNKENTYHHSNVLARTPCTEKGYEELDVSELNMKLRWSTTPAASPMSKSMSHCLDNRYNASTDESLNNTVINENDNNLTHSLHSTLNKTDTKLPLQTLAADFVDSNRNSTVLRPLDDTVTGDITITVNNDNEIDNISFPSSSSSVTHTPEATTPTKEIPKNDGGSPIMRGLKSVLSMFRSSQSPIPPGEGEIKPVDAILNPADTSQLDPKPHAVSSTPISQKSKERSLSRKNSPQKESLVFNEDLEKELQWNDDSTIVFSTEKIPIHKLFFQDKASCSKIDKLCLPEKEDVNSSVEFMDVSYGDVSVRDRTLNANVNRSKAAEVESDAEFVDCETTFTLNESQSHPEDANANKTDIDKQNVPVDIVVENNAAICMNDIQSLYNVTDVEKKSAMIDPQSTFEATKVVTENNDVSIDSIKQDLIIDPLSTLNVTKGVKNKASVDPHTKLDATQDIIKLLDYSQIVGGPDDAAEQLDFSTTDIVNQLSDLINASDTLESKVISEDVNNVNLSNNDTSHMIDVLKNSELHPQIIDCEVTSPESPVVPDNNDPVMLSGNVSVENSIHKVPVNVVCNTLDSQVIIDCGVSSAPSNKIESLDNSIPEILKETLVADLSPVDIPLPDENIPIESSDNLVEDKITTTELQGKTTEIVETSHNLQLQSLDEITTEKVEQIEVEPENKNIEINSPLSILTSDVPLPNIDNDNLENTYLPHEALTAVPDPVFTKTIDTSNITVSEENQLIHVTKNVTTAELTQPTQIDEMDVLFKETSSEALAMDVSIKVGTLPHEHEAIKEIQYPIECLEESKQGYLLPNTLHGLPEFAMPNDEGDTFDVKNQDLEEDLDSVSVTITDKTLPLPDTLLISKEYDSNIEEKLAILASGNSRAYIDPLLNPNKQDMLTSSVIEVFQPLPHLLETSLVDKMLSQSINCKDADPDVGINTDTGNSVNVTSTNIEAHTSLVGEQNSMTQPDVKENNEIQRDVIMQEAKLTDCGNDFEPTSNEENSKQHEEKMDEEILLSENNSPFVSMSGEGEIDSKTISEAIEKLENTSPNNKKFMQSPPISPKIISKGYNFNFDDLDSMDPFATKTKIRLSPPPGISPNISLETVVLNKPGKSQPLNKVSNANKRKSMPENKRQPIKINNFNPTFVSTECAPTKQPQLRSDDGSDTSKVDDKQVVSGIVETKIDEAKTLSQEITQILDTTQPKETDPTVTEIISCEGVNINTNLEEVSNTPDITCVTTDVINNDCKSSIKVDTSSSEQPTYFSAGTSSTDCSESKNVFNLPEIDDKNFNPFATKSKIRQTPPPKEINPSVITDIGNLSGSSKTSDENNDTVQEVHTEDEDTIEGPFLEAEDGDDRDQVHVPDNNKVNMVEFNNINCENTDAAEMFIDAEAFEFLMNQNKADEVAYSGKESLFLKFDPLFSRKITSEGVAAALSEIKRRQSTPKKAPTAVPPREEFLLHEKSVAGPSNLNITHETETLFDESHDDLNITVSKPMMVVPPAVNPVVTPRQTVTPNRTNRLSMTFTSPAMAVIDRLLSLSGSSPSAGLDSTVTHVSQEHYEADQALTQLRELLAEKEINVYNLRCESKELKNRLTALETQMKSLEAESEQRLKKVNELTENLSEKTKMNRNMAAVVEEYERTIASLISETEQDKIRYAEERNQLIRERDEQSAHLTSMEVSFNDLHSKYEKSKQIIMGYKTNEDTYKTSLKDFEDNLAKMHSNYELLKQHATSKLNYANQELEKLNKAHEAEVLKFNAMIKRKDLHITSLEESLAQKTKANEELTAICDELINKVG